MPSCNSISYDTEITNSKREVSQDIFEHVSIYFKKDYFLKVKRVEIIGWASFWSTTGGFLGLLMGASVLSMIEVFYQVFIKHCFGRRAASGNLTNDETNIGENLNKNSEKSEIVVSKDEKYLSNEESLKYKSDKN